MSLFRLIVAVIFIIAGVFFSFVSVLGTFKFKYVLNRMHSAAIGDTLAIFFVLTGLIILSGLNFASLKLAVIIIFFWLASPISGHLISNLVVTVDRKRATEICEYIDKDKKDDSPVEDKKDN